MNIKYFQEFQRFYKSDISNIFDNNQIEELFTKNILKAENKNYDTLYYFQYVGIICLENTICLIAPKYLSNKEIKDNSIVKNKMKLVISVLKIYFSKALYKTGFNIIGTENNIDKFNKFAIFDFLISDYLEYGLYENQKDTYEISGSGEVDWDKTINEVESFMGKNNTPVYLDYYTNEIEFDDNSYIKNLHKYFLNMSSNYFEKIDFLGLDYPVLNFYITEENLSNLEFQIFKIRQELQEEFSERKIRLLKTFLLLIENEVHETEESIFFYGTTVFYDVWEKVCAFVLKDNYKSYSQYISKITWTMVDGKVKHQDKTLTPDILVLKENIFFIFDAKYYNPDLDNIKNLPGVESITKQYMYELLFKDIEILKNKTRKNIFLIPSSKLEITYEGKAHMDFLSKLNLKDIELFSFPAEKAFKAYCENRCFSDKEFECFVKSL